MGDGRTRCFGELHLHLRVPLIVRVTRSRCGISRRILHLEGQLGAVFGGGHEEHDSQRVVGVPRDRDRRGEADCVSTRSESDAADEDRPGVTHQPTNARAVCSKSSVESRSDSWSIRSLFPWNIFAKSLNEIRSLMSPYPY